jgi:hypothetical protein
LNDHPPSPGEGGPALPANELSAARDDAVPGSAPAQPTTSATFAHGAPATEPFPWPPREGEGVIGALGRTWREVMFAPAPFFRRMPAPAPLGGALVYFLVVGVLASGIQLFWDVVALVLLPPTSEDSLWSLFLPTSAGDALISFFFAPLAMLCILFIGAAITHAVLRLLSAGGRGYGTSVRVFAYAQSPQLLLIVPFFGVFIAMLWSFVLAVIGLREAHRTTTAKALLALLLPIFALFLLLFMLVLVTIMGAAVMM